MSFDKLIITSMSGVAKNGIKMDLAVATLKDKVIDTTATQIENQVPIELPFDTRGILLGGNLPTNFLTPEVKNTAQDLSPTITEPQRIQITQTLDRIENSLNSVIQTKNTLSGTLNSITAPLNTVQTLGNTLSGVITGIKTGVTVIKAIPIPLGAPLGVGVPANVVTGFADALDTLGKVLDKIEGPLKIIPDAISQINNILIPIVNNLNSFDPIFDKTIKIIAFIRLLLQPPPVFQSDIDLTLSDITSGIQESLAVTAGPELSSSNPEENDVVNNSLLFLLENNKLFYRGFKLTLEFDPNNTLSFPARRIKATRTISADNASNQTGEAIPVTLYSAPPDQGSGVVNTSSPYSFSTSIQVLVDETKFNIDQYLLEFTGPPPVEEIPSATPLTPAQILENAVNQARQSLIDRGFTEKEARWIQEKSGLLVQNVIQQIDNGLTPEGFFKQILINKGLNEDFVTYLLSPSGSTAFTWVEYTETLPSPLTFTSIKQLIQIAVIQFKLDSNVALSFFL